MKFILIGFMGAGKTSIGKALANKLKLKMIEMDDLILKKSGRKSIEELFSKDGERQFREWEIEVAKDLQDRNNLIISTGGGVVMNRIILDYLRSNGKTIFLKTSFFEIEKRLKNDSSRPLFKDKNKARKLFSFRQSLYKEYADLIVFTDGKSVKKITYEIISKN